MLIEPEQKSIDSRQFNSNIIAIISWPDLKYVDVNDTFTKITGYTKEEIRGHHISDINIPTDTSEQAKMLRLLSERGRIDSEEYQFRMKSGEICTYLFSAEPIEINGKSYLVCTYTDITRKKMAQDALAASEERYRLMAENAQDLVFRISLIPEFKFDYVSLSSVNICGYTPEEHYANPAIRFNMVHPDDLDIMQKIIDSPEQYAVQPAIMRWIKKSGEIIWIEQKNVYVRNEAGDIIAIEGIISDITEKKKAVDALRTSEERYRLLAEHAQDIIYRVSIWPDIKFEYISPSVRAITGYTVDDFMADPSLSIKCFHPDDQELLLDMASSPENYFRKPITIRFLKKDGSIIWTEQLITPVYNAEGHKIALEGILRDITGRKQAEEKIIHLSHILSAIRTVNQLIVREKNQTKLIDDACNILVETHGANGACIILTDKENHPLKCAEAGLSKTTNTLVRLLEKGLLPPCCQENLRTYNIFLAQPADAICQQCPVCDIFSHNQKICIRLQHENIIYGFLIIASDSSLLDQEERDLLGELAGDIAYGLYGIEQERLLRESEEKFKRAFQSSPDAISISQLTDGHFIEVNDSYIKLTGFTREEIIGHSASELGMWDTPEQEEEVVSAIKRHQKFRNNELILRNKAGERHTWLMSTEYVTIAGDECLLVVSKDITERKYIENALADEANRRSILMEQSRDGIVILNEDGSVHESNTRFATMLGYSLEEIQSLYVWDWDSNFSVNQLHEMLATVDEAGDHFETQHRKKDGSYFPVEISTNGAIIGGRKYIFCVCRDISERKKTEEALRISDAAFKSIHDAVIVMDREWRVLQWNHVCEELFGITAEKAIGSFIGDLMEIAEEYPGQNIERISLLMSRNWNREEQLYRTPKGEIWVDVHIQAIEGENGNYEGWVTLAIDISERKQSEKLLRTISENSPIGSFILQDGTFRYISQRFQEYLGYSLEEILGKDAISYIHPDDRASVQTNITTMLGTKTAGVPYEYRVITKGGEIKRLVETVTEIQFEGEKAILGSALDVTELRKLERQVIEYQELNKLKTDLISTVSHELRTPLASIKGYATMLMDYFDRLEKKEIFESLISIDQATDRLLHLVKQLLEMSRLDAGLLRLDMVKTDPVRILRQAINEARLRNPDHEFIVNLPEELPAITIDVNRIRQVLDNLIDNATKFSPAGTDITITAAKRRSEIIFSVADQGQGIPPSELPVVFDRMYRIEQRLQPSAGGLGLGLSISKGLVEAHGGRIWAESDGSTGSCFYFALPLRKSKREKH